MTTATTRQIPSTDRESCKRYGATATRCSCPDRAKRAGGSYADANTGERFCKHMHHMRQIESFTQAYRAARPVIAKPAPAAPAAPAVWPADMAWLEFIEIA